MQIDTDLANQQTFKHYQGQVVDSDEQSPSEIQKD